MDIKLNKDEWENVSAEDRKKIEQIISSHFKDTKVVADMNAGTSKDLLAKRQLQAFNFTNPFCSAACGVAEAAAVAACSALSGGVAIAVCVAAAHAAGDYCRSRC
jgi:hypothetical protein